MNKFISLISRFIGYKSKIILIWSVSVILLLLLQLHLDIQKNKLLNYTIPHKETEINTRGNILDFTLKAQDNFLGTVFLPVNDLSEKQGNIIFRIRENESSKWQASNLYDFNYFNQSTTYPLGFPNFEDSKDKEYVISFEVIGSNLDVSTEFIDFNKEPLLTSKYIFPRTYVLDNPLTLLKIFKQRCLNLILNSNYFSLLTNSLFMTFVVTVTLLTQYKSTGKKPTQELPSKQLPNKQKLSKRTPFIFPVVILFILILQLLLGKIQLAEKLSVWIWVSLLLAVTIETTKLVYSPLTTSVTKLLDRAGENLVLCYQFFSKRKWLLVILALFYLTLSGLSKTYTLGGDDTRLYYVFPKDYLQNYASKIVGDTGVSTIVGLLPPPTIGAFTLILATFKKIAPVLNLQSLLESTNKLLGWIFFYHLLGYISQFRSKHGKIIRILAGLFYISSIFNAYSLYNSRLLAIYLLSMFPLSLLLFLKAVNEKKPYLLFGTAIIWSVFSFAAIALPWFLGVLITSIPLIFTFLWKKKLRLAKYSIFFAILWSILNIHWLAFSRYTTVFNKSVGSLTQAVSSQEFRRQNKEGVKTVSNINNVYFPLLGSYHKKIQENFNWPYLPIYSSWYNKLLPLNLLLIGVILSAGTSLKQKIKTKKSKLYLSLLFSFLLTIYLYTVNVLPFGIELFAWLTENIPLFVIVRNMYDKFAFVLAFQWALILAISLEIMMTIIKRSKAKRNLLFCTFVVVSIFAKPFFSGDFNKLPFWTTKNTFASTQQFNQDYLNLIDFIKNQDSAHRYLSIPMPHGNSFLIQDEYKENHYYNGNSPLLILTGKNDLSGIISFGDKGKIVTNWLQEKEYEKFGKLLQQLNVGYVIINNKIPYEIQKSYMYPDRLFYLQTYEMKQTILGQKIKDFGERYSLYKISDRFANEKIYLTNKTNNLPADNPNLSYKKIASYEYQVTISHLDEKQKLIFLEPYQDSWSLYSESGKIIYQNATTQPFGYAQGWEIDKNYITQNVPNSDYLTNDDGSLDIRMRIYFKPYDYFVPLTFFSIISYLLATIIFIRGLIIDYVKKS